MRNEINYYLLFFKLACFYIIHMTRYKHTYNMDTLKGDEKTRLQALPPYYF